MTDIINESYDLAYVVWHARAFLMGPCIELPLPPLLFLKARVLSNTKSVVKGWHFPLKAKRQLESLPWWPSLTSFILQFVKISE